MTKLVSIVLALGGLLVAWLFFAVMGVLPYLIIAVASVIPPAACVVASSRVPRLVLPLIYLASSAAVIWLLEVGGDYLLPWGTMIWSRHSTIDASGEYMAIFTGIMLALYGIVAAWIMIADAWKRWRKGPPPARRRSGKASKHRARELP